MSTKETPPASTQDSKQFSFGFKAAATLIALLAITLAFYTPLRAALSKQVSKFSSISSATSAAQRNMTTSNGTVHGPAPPVRVTKRPWDLRGHADHGWLYTYHTFSFASYHDPRYQEYGPLRVINEDRVEKGTGFGTHSHAEFLIWSYIVNGELEHKDSMGNLENLRRGEVQFTSAGTGIRHSEYNRNKKEDVHFLQIWAKPNVKGLSPSYKTRKFTDEMKADKLVRIIESTERHNGKDGESEPIPAHSDVSMSASILSPGSKVTHELVADGTRKVLVHVVMTGKTQPKTGGAKIKVHGVEIGEGDGAFVDNASGLGTKIEIESVGDKPAEFLLFDMGKEA
ncbi:hypothetical protein LTR56_021982 [Elasticomyces elasticus]|nr:hypothetical protein LTR56_021982 [Elasticomyces elasticus]KAK3630230.1 hypothetical protein LTR22_021608 [Elasticomyces elasticus]KAK4920144.1 hypothetical protein LTR49_012243 [Elasticomyces elasticus]KAK5748961.1 hypothetical protein LTS12_020998 [Elasticomyces elasticus]